MEAGLRLYCFEHYKTHRWMRTLNSAHGTYLRVINRNEWYWYCTVYIKLILFPFKPLILWVEIIQHLTTIREYRMLKSIEIACSVLVHVQRVLYNVLCSAIMHCAALETIKTKKMEKCMWASDLVWVWRLHSIPVKAIKASTLVFENCMFAKSARVDFIGIRLWEFIVVVFSVPSEN